MKLKVTALLVWVVWMLFLLTPAQAQNYGPAVNLPTQIQPLGVVQGDFNEDGKMDVLVANAGSSSLSLFPGNGDGTFGNAISIAVGTNPVSVAAADFNGDGHLDIAVTLGTAQSFQILFSNGNGTFQAPITISVPGLLATTSVGQIVSADFNGDHHPDLATATEQGIAVFLNDGTGNFSESASVDSLNNIGALAVADLNGDGRPDLVGVENDVDSAGNSVGEVVVALNNGNGTFQPQKAVFVFTGVPAGVAIGDINNDGLPDIVVSNAGTILSADGGGDPTCTPQRCLPRNVPPPPPQPVTIPGSIIALLQQGDGTFAATPELKADKSPGFIALADVDGDSFLDIIDASSSVAGVMVFRGLGAGSFSAPVVLTVSSSPAVVIATPLTNSVAPDLVVSEPGGNEISVFVNQGANTLTLASSRNPSQVLQSVTLTAVVRPKFAAGGTPSGSVIFADAGQTLGSAPVDPSGTSTLTTSFSNTGNHPLLAVYGGNGSLVGGSSARLNQVVNQEIPIITLTSAPNPSAFGQPVTLSINALGTGTTPTGTINVLSGSSIILSGPIDASGKLTLVTSTLPIGTSTLVVQYGGDSNNTSANSTPLVQTVTKGNTALAITSSVNPSLFGQSVLISVRVNSQNSPGTTPTGTITLLDGASSIGSATLDAAGLGTFNVNTFAPGPHRLTATYAGDASFIGATSPAFVQNVSKTDTTTTLLSSPNPSNFGQAVQITATVAPTGSGNGVPTGSVSFNNGTTSLGSIPLAAGKATLSIGSLSVGSHSITANYSGDSNFNSSSASGAAGISQNVSKSSTSVSVANSPNPSNFGQPVTLTATVMPSGGGAGTPSGQVTFLDGTALLGTASLSGGTATITVSSLGIGPHSIVASYAGDTNFLSSNSAPATQTVNKGATTTTLSGSPNPSSIGQNVILTATVVAQGGSSAIPTGTVTFQDGAGPFGTANLDATGKATFSTSSLTVGSHNLTAAYSGDANFLASSGVGSQVINKSQSATALSAAPNPSAFGEVVTFSVTVTASGGGSGIPTGSVVLADGATSIGTGQLDPAGKVTFTVATLSAGTHNINASYGGDSNFSPSSASGLGSVSLVIGRATTSSTLSTSPNPSIFGQGVTFSVRVTNSAAVVPSGPVTFTDGGSAIGTSNLDTNGNASLTINTLAVGVHTIVASFAGSGNFAPSTSNTISQTVNKNSVVVTLSSVPNPSSFGQAVTFSAQVVPPVGTGASVPAPSGTLTFTDGGTVLGTAKLDNTGTGSLATSTLTAGQHSITASYGGDSNFSSGSSTPYTQNVNKAATTVALASSINPATNVSTVDLKVSVGSSNGIPSGAITVFDGTQQVGALQLDSTGKAVLSLSNLSTGLHHLTAGYSGDTNFAASLSSDLQETIVDSHTAVVLSSSPNPQTVGGPVTFVATVSLALGGSANAGTVSFLDGQQVLGTIPVSGSVASFTTKALSVGTHSIIASYQAATAPGAFDGKSSVLAEVINPAPDKKKDFALSIHDTVGAIRAGQNFTTKISLTPINGLTGSVNTVCTGAPIGATCTITPAKSLFDGKSSISASLVITTTAARSRDYHTPSSGEEGPKPKRPIPSQLSFALLPAFGWVLWPGLKKKRNSLIALAIVALSLTGCGGGYSGGQTPPSTPPGTYMITVQSQSGAVNHSQTIQLVVR